MLIEPGTLALYGDLIYLYRILVVPKNEAWILYLYGNLIYRILVVRKNEAWIL